MTKHHNQEAVKCYNLKLPATLHEKLVKRAIKDRRSLADQIIYFLEQALVKPSVD